MKPGQDYFDALYRQSDDPWGFAHSSYERRKYAITLALLPKAHYDRVLEPACSIGELTVQLAGRASHVLALDRAPRAVRLARQNAERRGVSERIDLRVQDLRDALDEGLGLFDLVVLSELLYYLNPSEAAQLTRRCAGLVRPGGAMAIVHWRGSSPDHACTGDEVHAAIADLAGGGDSRWGMQVRTRVQDRGFVAEVWERAPDDTVADGDSEGGYAVG